MSKMTVPGGYKPVMSLYETQGAISLTKRAFEENLSAALHLIRASAPLVVDPDTGLNDNLNGIERPVEFDLLETKGHAQIVQSLAKWKRMALYRYGFKAGEGIYTDMNAIRRDESMDNIHSIYVDQWDWERIIDRQTRTISFLKEVVKKIVDAICDTQNRLHAAYPQLTGKLDINVSFITTQELEDMYPAIEPKERENVYLREHPTAFIMQIGDKLKSGIPHDGRAPDYDDWTMNGDILFWNDLLQQAFEISSMGIRVDEKSLDEQLTKAGCNDRRGLPFHKMLLSGELPLTIGGGIGQSRLCMLLLEKAHIGEVQVSIWDTATTEKCKAVGIPLL
ncbi:MAG: aspartate--ammonia ligase [Christensenellales bacterium]